VRKGAVFPLNLRMDQPDPPLYGRGRIRQTLLARPSGRDDYLDNVWPQASSQWDSLRHIRHPEHGFYNGTRDEDIAEGGGPIGIDAMARRGIAGRGVLLDIARYFSRAGRPIEYTRAELITPDDLEACRAAQGVALHTGDVLLIHTGWLHWYLTEATAAQRERMADREQLQAIGLGPADTIAEYLWDVHVAAVAADNPALEAWPPREETGGFAHFRLIPLLGMPIGELWQLAPLAADCAADGVHECFFTSAPLNVPGGVGSPPNALAVK